MFYILYIPFILLVLKTHRVNILQNLFNEPLYLIELNEVIIRKIMSRKDKIRNNNLQVKAEKCESLDEGTFAFLKWMNCKSFIAAEDNYTQNPPLILKHINFPYVTQVKLFDRCLNSEILVDIVDGVPLCKRCITDDCSHIGFTICLKQLIDREGFETDEDILK